ncbi:unnamed protein product [Fraxinus pennsylvanica]|uniref:DUF641 domain-containing protein n=1 Tax=Fraxinus pennsylvanica TaxID=56036 RepID=A0AAD1ZJY5_9LAMI|nr:unnamed protein product [Fraxinus pennsylvanica]
MESRSQGMEFAGKSKSFNQPSNISEIVSKFAKVCKLRSVGVFNTSESQYHSHNHQQFFHNTAQSLAEESSRDATEEAEFDAEKIHSQSAETRKEGNKCGHMEILKLFSTLSALKLAYVKLQEAHIPYNPGKIRAADENVVSELESLCKIKRAYKEKLLKESNTLPACSALLLAETQVEEKVLEKLKYKLKDKDNEVVDLQQQLRAIVTRNKELTEGILEQEKKRIKAFTHSSFEDVVKAAGKAIHDFAKPLIALMKVSDWDLDQAANAIENSVVYAKRSHKKYAFEAYVVRRMFHGFQPQLYNADNILKSGDPIDALIEDPQSSFAKFCRTKYLLVVRPEMEISFFGNLDHRTFVANGMHPHTPFYRAFVKMARWVWFLLGFTASIEPKVEMFGVKQGSEFSDVYMEFIEELKEYKALLDKGHGSYKVEFMVMPGFKIGESLIRSQVYVSKTGLSNETF